jgi:hypothetical protein
LTKLRRSGRLPNLIGLRLGPMHLWELRGRSARLRSGTGHGPVVTSFLTSEDLQPRTPLPGLSLWSVCNDLVSYETEIRWFALNFPQFAARHNVRMYRIAAITLVALAAFDYVYLDGKYLHVVQTVANSMLHFLIR